MILVDSSAWIEMLRENGNPDISQQVQQALLQGEAHWCEMVRLELWNGARGAKEKSALKRFDDALPVLTITNHTWALATELANACRSKGITAPATDLLIAACAREHGAHLLHNDKDFTAIESAIRKHH